MNNSPIPASASATTTACSLRVGGAGSTGGPGALSPADPRHKPIKKKQDMRIKKKPDDLQPPQTSSFPRGSGTRVVHSKAQNHVFYLWHKIEELNQLEAASPTEI